MKIKALAVVFLFLNLVAGSIASSMDQGAYNLSVSANALIRDYEQNEVLADSKYAGRRISVGGKVVSVGRDSDGDPYIILRSDNPETSGHDVHCRSSEAFNGRIATLKPGSLIGIRGTVVGYRGGAVLLKDCSL